MELRTLRYFLAIAEDENMTLAANRLHLSQSALSRQLTELEDTLGRKLFLRAGRRMLLTEDGIRLTDGLQLLLGDFAEHADGKARTGERLP